MYVDESWSLWRELSSSLYDHSAERTKWALIYVFVTYVNRSENRKTDRFTASYKRVDMQKLSRAFAVYVYVMYMSCSICAKTLLSFCVYEQRLCCVFAMYVIVTLRKKVRYVNSLDSDLSKHMIYQIDHQVIEHNRTIKTSSYSTQ